MPQLTLTITADTPEELFSSIKGAAVVISDDIPAKELPPEDEKSPKEPLKEPSEDSADKPTYTIEQVRKLATAAARAHSTDKVKEILKSFNVSGVGELKEDQYPEFVDKLEALNNG